MAVMAVIAVIAVILRRKSERMEEECPLPFTTIWKAF
jgi:hypothetical protein